jgi:hypothetical protein
MIHDDLFDYADQKPAIVKLTDANRALGIFWSNYFSDQELVAWTIFESSLFHYLSSPREEESADKSNDNDDSDSTTTRPATIAVPIPPMGYGLPDDELSMLFGQHSSGDNNINFKSGETNLNRFATFKIE